MKEIQKKLGLGDIDICICPECGYKIEHKRGISCSDMRCPGCDVSLVSKDMPHGKGQRAK